MKDKNNWAFEENKETNYGDKRLDSRFIEILDAASKNPDESIPAKFKSWTETIATYRFFNNEKVTPSKILSCHKASTIERIKQEKIVLMPQDTSDISFSGRKSIEGMGYLNTEKSMGVYIHPTIAVTPNGLHLGIVDFQYWNRSELGVKADKKNKSIEHKESHCWLKGYEAANNVALQAPKTIVVSISDREGDIYEVLSNLPSDEKKAFWLIRSSYNRKTKNENEEDEVFKMHELVKSKDSMGEIEFKLPKGKIYSRSEKERSERRKRTVKQQIRSCQVTILPPKRLKGKEELAPITINIIHCKEINPPSLDDCLEWFLVTSLPVKNLEDASNIINWYLCRWTIETFFKVLKSGCNVEKLQFKSLDAMLNCIALYHVVAWRILYLTTIGRTCPEIECTTVFEEEEWKSVYIISTGEEPPIKPPNLNTIIIMIAKLGGYLDRKCDEDPGAKTMWIGLKRAKDFALAYNVFMPFKKRCV